MNCVAVLGVLGPGVAAFTPVSDRIGVPQPVGPTAADEVAFDIEAGALRHDR